MTHPTQFRTIPYKREPQMRARVKQIASTQTVTRRITMPSFVCSLNTRVLGCLMLAGVLLPCALLAQTPIPPLSTTTTGNTVSVAGKHGMQGGIVTPTQATQSEFIDPSGIVFDSSGNMYIADSENGAGGSGKVYKVDPTGLMTFIA